MKKMMIVLTVMIAAVSVASAATWNVDVHNFAFVPANLTIAHGDTVHWHNSAGFHSVHHVGTPSLFGTASATAPWDYSFVFNNIGDSTFHYLCQVHPSTMLGTVTVTPASAITVSAPNGGESWYEGELRSINWTSQGVASNVMIELNRDYPNGSWEMLFSDIPNSGSQPWVVTSPVSSTCRIRIMSMGANMVEDVSDADFSISTLIAPQNLVVSSEGTDVTLTWLPVAGATAYNIYRSTDPGLVIFTDFVGTTLLNTLTDVNAPAGNAKLFYQVRAVRN
jgi:plastocyanin